MVEKKDDRITWTKAQIQLLKEAHKAGESTIKIASRLRRSYSAVNKKLIEITGRKPRKYTPWTTTEKEIIRKSTANNTPIKQTQKELRKIGKLRKASQVAYQRSVHKSKLCKEKLLLSDMLAGWVREHRFHSIRMWRFDFALPDKKIGFEYEGFGKGHFTCIKYAKDCEKYNEAARLGWVVYRVTAINMRDPEQLKFIESIIHDARCTGNPRKLR